MFGEEDVVDVAPVVVMGDAIVVVGEVPIVVVPPVARVVEPVAPVVTVPDVIMVEVVICGGTVVVALVDTTGPGPETVSHPPMPVDAQQSS